MIKLLPIFLFCLGYGETIDVSIVNFSFVDQNISITTGDLVRWTNNDGALHTSTASDGSWNSEDLSQGESYTHEFSSEGSFNYFCGRHISMTGTVTVSALNTPQASILSDKFQLHSSYPNPFNPATNVTYSLFENANVELIIYDIQGNQLSTLFNEFQTAGDHSIYWDA